MPAVTIGKTGLSWGLTDETIGVVQSFSETRNIEKNELKNREGETVGVAYYNSTTAYSLSFAAVSNGVYNGAPGTALAALANATSFNTTSGRIDSITINKSNDSFVTVDITATGYPQLG